MHEDQYDNDPLEIDETVPGPLPDAITALAAAAWQAEDLLHVLLDALACEDPRTASIPFAIAIEGAIDRLADVRAHLRAAYPERGA